MCASYRSRRHVAAVFKYLPLEYVSPREVLVVNTKIPIGNVEQIGAHAARHIHSYAHTQRNATQHTYVLILTTQHTTHTHTYTNIPYTYTQNTYTHMCTYTHYSTIAHTCHAHKQTDAEEHKLTVFGSSTPGSPRPRSWRRCADYTQPRFRPGRGAALQYGLLRLDVNNSPARQ